MTFAESPPEARGADILGGLGSLINSGSKGRHSGFEARPVGCLDGIAQWVEQP